MRAPRTALAAVALAAVLAPVPAAPAGAAGCVSATGSGPISALPWANRWLAPERAWPLSRAGAGVTVAVVDTGVDARHGQLRGAVLAGLDLVQPGGDGRLDCAGHGTGVASLIAGRPGPGVGFVGLAPQARILPVRVAERPGDDIDAGRVAQGIRWAVARGAKVVNVSLVVPDRPALRAAVAEAVRRGVVVVATAGEAGGGRRPTGSPYPAGYDGVLGVRAVGQDGLARADGWPGPHVDLAAPGVEMITVAPVLGHTVWSGSDMAAAEVSGAAALLRAGLPTLTGPAVADRLTLTADPAPGGPHSPGYGYGYVDPYRALAEPAASVPAGPRPAQVLAVPPPRRPDTRVAHASILVAAILLGATTLLLLALAIRARRRAQAGRPAYATGRPEHRAEQALYER